MGNSGKRCGKVFGCEAKIKLSPKQLRSRTPTFCVNICTCTCTSETSPEGYPMPWDTIYHETLATSDSCHILMKHRSAFHTAPIYASLLHNE